MAETSHILPLFRRVLGPVWNPPADPDGHSPISQRPYIVGVGGSGLLTARGIRSLSRFRAAVTFENGLVEGSWQGKFGRHELRPGSGSAVQR